MTWGGAAAYPEWGAGTLPNGEQLLRAYFPIGVRPKTVPDLGFDRSNPSERTVANLRLCDSPPTPLRLQLVKG